MPRRTPRWQQMADPESESLSAVGWSYAEVGATAGRLPESYHWTVRARMLPPGTDYDAAVERLLSWHVQLDAGLGVHASTPRAEQGSVVVLRLGIGPLATRAPCRVVYVIDEGRRAGFAYGTLPGHPESGEEAFLLDHLADGRTRFGIIAFSRPATALARVAGPVGRLAQAVMTGRYLRAVTTGS